MAEETAKLVCVTGGSEDEKETKHLQALEGAETRLRLFEIDLLDYESIVKAVSGVSGVFHLASPCIVDRVYDPEKELLEPALKGTNNVLTAAKELGVKRVVVTSSVSAIIPSPSWPADVPKTEDCWTDAEYCKQNEVIGSVIEVAKWVARAGCTDTYENYFMGSVHVKDVALAHILVYENTSATGRHLCVEAITHYGDFAAKVAELYPEYNIPRLPKDTQPGLLRYKTASKKLMDLGLEFIPMEQIIKDSVESLQSKGFIS
ncbi:cinnamoyl-CoA reductase 1 [Tanacetum coccineum]|uniref:Cinnamoyl-CoA reductase 1 n=1 Tax=Tanacetum coccineum TaxID=301880 RepID=A0ABQ5FDS4_9ASTR